MYRMYGQDLCSGQILSTHIHVSNAAVPWKNKSSCIIFISTIHGGHGKERRMLFILFYHMKHTVLYLPPL